MKPDGKKSTKKLEGGIDSNQAKWLFVVRWYSARYSYLVQKAELKSSR